MKKYPYLIKRFNNQRGAVAILVGIGIVLLLSLVALAIDVAYTWVTRNELQNISDASSLAATRKLGDIYGDLSNPLSDEQVAAIRQPAIDMGSANQAGGQGIVIDSSDILIGRWDAASKTFTEALSWTAPSLKPKAVKVIARRDSSTYGNGPITTFFAGIMGQPTKEVSAKAVANLSGVCIAKSPIPVGISDYMFDPLFIPPPPPATPPGCPPPPATPFGYCNNAIRLYPTGEGSCAGWNTYFTTPASANTLRDILEGLAAGTYPIPEVRAGEDSLRFTGGTIASVFPYMLALFNAMKGLNDDVYDFDTDPNTWTTYVPVYDSSGLSDPCGNPGGSTLRLIRGFAMITITCVTTSPENTIWGHIVCDKKLLERGGCLDAGVVGEIPGLVQ